VPRSMIVIPARLASNRLPGKLLLDLAGKPMLQHCWELACAADIGAVWIATEDEAIEQAASAFGAKVIRTGAHTSGTERIAEAINQLDLAPTDVIINLQGDEPLLPVAVIRNLHEHARQKLDSDSGDAAFSVCTPLHDSSQLLDPNQVKVVLDRSQRALLFTRAAIPWSATSRAGRPDASELIKRQAVYLHHGLYAYTAATLWQWHALPPGQLEQIEALEQLRLLENGLSISMLISQLDVAELTRCRGVDTADDLQRVRDLLCRR
jgi:3-deoxy-manno-octulosonate cytidylyltransferase (CMP-KDO synthetase)